MLLRTSTLAIVGILTFTTVSFGQGAAVPSPPSSAFNWLNLQRQGNGAAANYYQLVRPNFQTQNALQNIQQEYNSLTQSATNPNNNTTEQATGHAATFMNYGHYYPKLGAGSGGGAARPGGGAPRR